MVNRVRWPRERKQLLRAALPAAFLMVGSVPGAAAQQASAFAGPVAPDEKVLSFGRAAFPANAALADLPDAPMPAGWPRQIERMPVAGPAPQGDALLESGKLAPAFFSSASEGYDPLRLQPAGMEGMSVHLPREREWVKLRDCPYTKVHAPECGVHWGELAISTALFNTFQNSGNAYTGYYYRYETTHGKWFDRYVNSVTGYQFGTWSDGNPKLDDYVGHPLMGDISDYLWIQNDPKGMTVPFGNNYPYWRSRLRALAFSTFYSTEWKLGPFGESGVGHAGDHLAYEETEGGYRNETGFVSLVTTPVGGLLWTVGEDALDKYVVKRLQEKSHNWFLLTLESMAFAPGHATANVLRFRPLWYRDDRVVKASSVWSDPDEGSAGVTAEGPGGKETALMKGVDREARDERNVEHFIGRVPPPDVDLPGGKHELGVWWGLSLHSGHYLGYDKDVKWMPINVKYSYRFWTRETFALRYAPELTALALLDEPNWAPVDQYTLRRRTYGSGLTPVGFEMNFFPRSRVQPFLSEHSGLDYFYKKVLSPDGSQLLFTTDLGLGVNIFRKMRQDVTIAYRYQHLSNANISDHNPGTDANTFYVGVSRFRTKGVL